MSENINHILFCVQPKKIFKNIPFLGKLEVNRVAVMAAHRRTCSFDGFCTELTAIAMETLMAVAGAGLA